MSEVREQVGKIRLSVIVADWSDTQTINPRLLAREVACLLHTLPTAQVLHQSIASVSLYDSAAGIPGITHRALADYFDVASQGISPETITTSTDKVIAAAVFISRTWINRVVDEATQRAAAVAGYISVANDVTSLAVLVNGAQAGFELSVPQSSSSSPGYMKMQQAHQRRNGEKSAAEQLDAALNKAEEDGRKINELSAAITIKDAQITALREEVEHKERETNVERRAKQNAENEAIELEEQLEQVLIFAECLRADNPLRPPELHLAFQCWRGITRDSTHNPSAPGGAGVHFVAQEWLIAKGYKLNKGETERLCAMVSWRKRGAGAVRTQ